MLAQGYKTVKKLAARVRIRIKAAFKQSNLNCWSGN